MANRSRGVNPQEATIPEEHEEDLMDSPQKGKGKEPNLISNETKRRKKKNGKLSKPKQSMNKDKQNGDALQMKRRKRRNRVAYMATMDRDDNGNSSTNGDLAKELPPIPLPMNQYVTTLCRRAIRKRESDGPPSRPCNLQPTPTKNDNHEEGESERSDLQEKYGDISLGMKLTVVGGKVIVQRLNTLSDGRASPAQVVGVIQRGDVLLSINNKSLVNLPIDLMMERLRPMSTPDSLGEYQRILELRMEAGAGLHMLEKYEAAEARKANIVSTNDSASEVFSLFPMADQLSALPSFENSTMTSPTPTTSLRHPQHQEEKKQTEDISSPPPQQKIEQKDSEESKEQNDAKQGEKSLDSIISNSLAKWRQSERINFTSEYYAWNDSYSELLRPSEGSKTIVAETKDHLPTKTEMLELGRRALVGAVNLSIAMGKSDRGKDMRSFRSWNASISLRSGASTRRRYVLDAVSLPVKFDTRSASPKGQNTGASLASTDGSDMDDVDGDALLLRLAAHDEIWRGQVIDALKSTRDKLADGTISDDSDDEEYVASKQEAEDPISKELGAFLFGETLAKVVTKKKKSRALPPGEITAVLFDLSTNLASTMPDEVAVGESSGLKSSLVPFSNKWNPEAGNSVILATRFVLDEALAVWLETFRPLPWESRRVLWPQAKPSSNGVEGHSSSMFSDNDSLTIDSGMSPTTAFTSATHGTRSQSRDLRQQIEDQELDMETRAETCFLVTYYITQRLLPKLAPGRTSDDAKATEEIVAFIRRYGAYMKLHTCMAYAAALKCPGVIGELLALAEHDLRHREVMKLFSKRQPLILYEPTMLSAIVKCLPIMREESNADRRQVLVDVCVSAYPDLCPWQVRQALVSTDGSKGGKQLQILYYYYLSSLLHPQDGHEAARHDTALVEEWCKLSLDEGSLKDEPGANTRRKNFLCVASLNSSDHLGYHRDLAMLIELSMSSKQYSLALDLANEIVVCSSLSQQASTLELALDFLRAIAADALDKGDQNETFRTLKRVVRLLQQVSQTSNLQVSVSEELHAVLAYKESQRGSSQHLLELIHFLAKEAPPDEFLQAFNTWTSSHDRPLYTVAVLQAVLQRGTKVALNAELSGSLLRLQRARQRMKSNVSVPPPHKTRSTEPKFEGSTVWSLMSEGLVSIDK